MEEILASIRRIIADDQSLPAHASREPALRSALAPPAEPRMPPVHVLRPDPAPAEEAPAPLAEERPGFRSAAYGSISPAQVASAAERKAAPVPPPAPEMAAAPVTRAAPPATQAAPATSATASAAVQPAPQDEAAVYDAPLGQAAPAEVSKAGSLFSQATNQAVSSAFGMLAATRLADNSDELLAMTRDMIRPMLKAWLDDNLPSMVERLVRAEIERVSRGGR